jgi:hypothetical protein
MSVDRTDYVIYGVNVGYDNVSWDDFEAELSGSPDARFDIIRDGMNGEYAWAGKILARGDQYEGFGNGMDLSPHDESQIVAMWEVIQAFPDLKLGMNDFKLYAVSHFH